jgi:hypothetical protein
MPKVPAFYSINEIKKDAAHRVFHDNDACAPGRDIPANERRPGTAGYRRCDVCAQESKLGH